MKPIGITIDDELSFTTHIENLCSTAINHSELYQEYADCYRFSKENVYLSLHIMSTLRYCSFI